MSNKDLYLGCYNSHEQLIYLVCGYSGHPFTCQCISKLEDSKYRFIGYMSMEDVYKIYYASAMNPIPS